MSEDLKQFSGDEVVRVPASLLRKSSIPKSSIDFLTTVGVPTREGLLFPFFRQAQDFLLWSNEGRSYLVLAEERGQKLCLDLQTGNIFMVDSRGELPTRFVNSDIESLVSFLKFYSDAQTTFRQSPEGAPKIISDLRGFFARKDPRALEGDENWWAVILEQTEEGLM